MAVRRRGIRFSQQMTAPNFPTDVSNTGSVDPSPKPQMRRSDAVGINLRCFPRYSPPESKKTTVQYKVPPARSITPMTRDSLYLPAKAASLSVSGPAQYHALASISKHSTCYICFSPTIKASPFQSPLVRSS